MGIKKQKPSDRIREKISARKLSDYIQKGTCSKLMIIYEVNLGLNGFESGNVIALDDVTALWNYLIRESPLDYEDKFNELYRGNGSLGKFVRQTGVYRG